MFRRKIHAVPSVRQPDESETAYKDRQARAYFEAQLIENEEWCRRLGGDLDFQGKRVLDFGCGHGALSVRIAQAGAAEVLGIDLDEQRIAFARRHVNRSFPECSGRVQFDSANIAHLPHRGHFDVVVSKDTFEHVDDTVSVLKSIAAVLRPGGVLIAGFSPLYYSPFGDHGRLRLPLPWLHAFLPDRLLLTWANRRKGTGTKSIQELGLNKMTPRQFQAALQVSALEIKRIQYNRGDNPLMPVMDALRHLPWLEKFFTVSIYVTAERVAELRDGMTAS